MFILIKIASIISVIFILIKIMSIIIVIFILIRFIFEIINKVINEVIARIKVMNYQAIKVI